MDTIKLYALRAWVWCVNAWHAVANFAPWKALGITWLIQMVFLFVLYTFIYVVSGGWQVPGILRFIVNVASFLFIYMKLVYPRCYPNGWQGGRRW